MEEKAEGMRSNKAMTRVAVANPRRDRKPHKSDQQGQSEKLEESKTVEVRILNNSLTDDNNMCYVGAKLCFHSLLLSDHLSVRRNLPCTGSVQSLKKFSAETSS